MLGNEGYGNMNEETKQPELTFYQRVAGIFTDPVPVFHAVAKKPDWFRPFLIYAVIMALLGVAQSLYMDEAGIEEQLRARFEQRDGLSREQVDKQIDAAMKVTRIGVKLSPIVNVITVFIFFLITSGVLYAGYVFFTEADLNYKQVLSVYSYAALVTGIKIVLSLLVIFLKGNIADMRDPLIRTDATLILGSLFPDTSVWYSILKRFDVFSIWELVLWIIGFSVVGKVSRKQSAMIAIIYYIIVSVLVVGLLALGLNR